jgi:eukaryotic-like serine/threonine-protein kinase
MADEFKYVAFISYSHLDKKWGDWLHRALESYRVPRRLVGTAGRDGPVPRRLFPVFRDREELPTAADLGEQINDALANSACLIVVCSPNSAKSIWVNQEILTFKRMGRDNRILAIIVDGEPNASDKTGLAAAECFPPALRF